MRLGHAPDIAAIAMPCMLLQLVAEQRMRLHRPDTFSLGVCNGCQLMALLGWVPGGLGDLPGGLLPDVRQPRFVHNTSGRFESRWAHVTVQPSPAVLLKGMEGATVGIWCAHGEGRAVFPDPDVLDAVVEQHLAPIK